MIKSMTGYGRAEKLYDDCKVSVEIKSVNNRYLDCGIKVYKQYSFVEEAVRECISKGLSRGKVDVFIQIDANENDGEVITVNSEIAGGYYKALKTIGEELGIENDVTVSTLSRFQDIFNIEKPEQDKEKIISYAAETAALALGDISLNRAGEGKRLYAFFTECIDGIGDILEVIKGRSQQTVDEYKANMREKIEETLKGIDYDEGRLLTEVAIFADKVNITEELVRFESHLKEFKKLLESDAPVGRKLDFTIQELNREANTMGSKCNDFIIGKAVVDLKSELEKLREQVQNIE